MISEYDKRMIDIEWQHKLKNVKMGLKIQKNEKLSEELKRDYDIAVEKIKGR